MIFLLGTLSLIQVLFLPGLILLRFLNLQRGLIQNTVFAFGLSLIFNFSWVLLLTMLGVNYPFMHYGLFILEVGALAWLYRKRVFGAVEDLTATYQTRIGQTLDSLRQTIVGENQPSSLATVLKTLLAVAMFAWAIGSLLWVSKLFIINLGTAFKAWDAVVSWNNWAQEWFHNVLPSPLRYAQLIPANFSITYSFLNSADIQFFAKGFMPLFTIFTWLLMLDLALEYKKPGMLIGIVILRYMTKKFLGPYIGEGYVDVALLFFAFLTVYTLLKTLNVRDRVIQYQYITLGAVFAAGTALTKQNGLLIFGLYPVLAYLLMEEKTQQASFTEQIKPLVKPMLIGLAVLLPWYVLNEARILMGLNATNVEFLMSAERHSGRTYLERAIRAFSILEEYALLFPFVLGTLPLIPKRFRQISLITIYPYTIIWAFLFSIFPRNLAMAFPFLAMAAGLGVEGVVDLVLRLGHKINIQRLKVVYVLIPIAVLIVGMGQIFTDQRLSDLQVEDQKNALFIALNNKLYSHFESRGEFGMIMTKYPLQYLPILDEYRVNEPFTIYKEFSNKFQTHPEVEYFLIWDKYSSEEVMDHIFSFESAGALVRIFEEPDFLFFEVVDREAILRQLPKD